MVESWMIWGYLHDFGKFQMSKTCAAPSFSFQRSVPSRAVQGLWQQLVGWPHAVSCGCRSKRSASTETWWGDRVAFLATKLTILGVSSYVASRLCFFEWTKQTKPIYNQNCKLWHEATSPFLETNVQSWDFGSRSDPENRDVQTHDMWGFHSSLQMIHQFKSGFGSCFYKSGGEVIFWTIQLSNFENIDEQECGSISTTRAGSKNKVNESVAVW
jgi:hypothetical protein